MNIEFSTVLNREDEIPVDVEITVLRDGGDTYSEDVYIKHAETGKKIEITEDELINLEAQATEIVENKITQSWINMQGQSE